MNRQILRLALPNILTNLTVPLLGMTDMFLMGHQESIHFMGGVALGSVIFNFVFWGFAFLRMSMSGVAAQTCGRNDRFEMAMVLERGLIIAVFGSLLLLLLQKPLADLSFWILEGSSEVKEISKQYYYVRIWAAPASISLMVFYGWFLGMQNAIYPMIIAVTVNIVNIATSFVFVFCFNMKAEGVALGSVIGEYFGVFLAIFFFLKKYRWVASMFTINIEPIVIQLRHFLNVSGDIFIRTLCIIGVFTFFTSRSAGISDVTLAVNSTLLQYLFLFSYFLDGFAYSGEALVGKYYGAHEFNNLKKSVRKLMIWGVGFAILFASVYALSGSYLLRLFTSQEAVLLQGRDYLVWIVIIPLVSFASYIWDGVFIGLTSSLAMRNSVLFSAGFFFFIPFFLFFPVINNHAIWLGMVLFMLSRSVSLTLLYKRLLKRLE